MRGVGFGTSIPTAAFPGIGATMRSDCARIASARSSAREAIRPTLTPGPGASSKRVTTGPTVLSTIRPPTRNVSSVATNRPPISSICSASVSTYPAGGSVRRSIGGIRPTGGGPARAGAGAGAGFAFFSLE